MTPSVRRGLLALGLAVLFSGALAACGKGGENKTPEPPPAMDLAGSRVMIMPARARAPVELDQELVARLTDRAPRTDWIPPAEIRETVASIPARFSLDAPRRLVDLGGGQLRLQDPLYGDVRRLAAVLDASMAVVPLTTTVSRDSLGTTLELGVVVVSIHGGRVLWFHTVTGGPGETAAVAAADAAAALARTLILP